MGKTKNLILVDFKVQLNWTFVERLRKSSDWDLKSCINNTGFYHTQLGGFIRYLLYFFFPLKIVFLRKKYDVILGWQQFYALNLAFWLRLFRARRLNRIVVMTFIYKEKKGVLGKIYKKYISYCLKSGHIYKVICYSSSEVDRYMSLFELPEGIVRFVPLGIEKDIDCTGIVKGDYVFSTGRSNRNYVRMLELFNNSKYKLKIACEEDFGQLSDNIEICHSCYDNEMLSLMKGCFCVCVLLNDPLVSSGQLVILQALQCGKPVIINRCSSIADYVKDGVNGFLVDSDDNSVLEKVQLLKEDDKLYDIMSENCRKIFDENFTMESLADNILISINNVF